MKPTLPPLNALRAFESAARHGGYVGAAGELGVSPAAVSRQVRILEDFLGKRLFRRYNNRIALTDAGQTVFSGASGALGSLAALTEEVVAGRARSRLVVSAIPSMAERWMAPRLATYRERVSQFRFDLRSEEDLVDFTRGEIDLRLAYGANLYPDMVTIPLMQDAVVPMCSPAYRSSLGAALDADLAAVPDDALIHTDWGPSFVSHPGWRLWFSPTGRVPDESRGYRVGASSLALDLAVRGVGVALGQRRMGADDLASGRLVVLSDRELPLGHPYCLIHPPAKARKAGLIDLLAWLRQAA
jgi:LysR family glycine cleavage system transcriptional activator